MATNTKTSPASFRSRALRLAVAAALDDLLATGLNDAALIEAVAWRFPDLRLHEFIRALAIQRALRHDDPATRFRFAVLQ